MGKLDHASRHIPELVELNKASDEHIRCLFMILPIKMCNTSAVSDLQRCKAFF